MKTSMFPQIDSPQTQADPAVAQVARRARWRVATRWVSAVAVLLAAASAWAAWVMLALVVAGVGAHWVVALWQQRVRRDPLLAASLPVAQSSPAPLALLQRSEAERAVGQRFLQGGD